MSLTVPITKTLIASSNFLPFIAVNSLSNTPNPTTGATNIPLLLTLPPTCTIPSAIIPLPYSAILTAVSDTKAKIPSVYTT